MALSRANKWMPMFNVAGSIAGWCVRRMEPGISAIGQRSRIFQSR